MNQAGSTDFMRRNRTSDSMVKQYVGFAKSDASEPRMGVASLLSHQFVNDLYCQIRYPYPLSLGPFDFVDDFYSQNRCPRIFFCLGNPNVMVSARYTIL